METGEYYTFSVPKLRICRTTTIDFLGGFEAIISYEHQGQAGASIKLGMVAAGCLLFALGIRTLNHGAVLRSLDHDALQAARERFSDEEAAPQDSSGSSQVQQPAGHIANQGGAAAGGGVAATSSNQPQQTTSTPTGNDESRRDPPTWASLQKDLLRRGAQAENRPHLIRYVIAFYAIGTAFFAWYRVIWDTSKGLLLLAAVHNCCEWMLLSLLFLRDGVLITPNLRGEHGLTAQGGVWRAFIWIWFVICTTALIPFKAAVIFEHVSGIMCDFMLARAFHVLHSNTPSDDNNAHQQAKKRVWYLGLVASLSHFFQVFPLVFGTWGWHGRVGMFSEWSLIFSSGVTFGYYSQFAIEYEKIFYRHVNAIIDCHVNAIIDSRDPALIYQTPREQLPLLLLPREDRGGVSAAAAAADAATGRPDEARLLIKQKNAVEATPALVENRTREFWMTLAFGLVCGLIFIVVLGHGMPQCDDIAAAAGGVRQGPLTGYTLLKAKPGRGRALRSALTPMVPEVRKEEGCLNYDLYSHGMQEDSLLFIETWKDKCTLSNHIDYSPAVNKYFRSPYATSMVAEKQLAGPWLQVDPKSSSLSGDFARSFNFTQPMRKIWRVINNWEDYSWFEGCIGQQTLTRDRRTLFFANGMRVTAVRTLEQQVRWRNATLQYELEDMPGLKKYAVTIILEPLPRRAGTGATFIGSVSTDDPKKLGQAVKERAEELDRRGPFLAYRFSRVTWW